MKATKIKAGQIFHRWTVIREMPRRNAHRIFRCRCMCGRTKNLYLGTLLQGRSKSCGCLQSELAKKHGMWKSVEYGLWAKMIWRCSPRARKQEQRNYHKRGIKVCEEWKASFMAFYQHLGPRPSAEHSIDRIDNDKGYEPGNVRWATRSQQRRNKRCSIWERIVLLLAKEAHIDEQWVEDQISSGSSDLEVARHIARCFKQIEVSA